MNILVLGATGRVGQMIIQRALADQHHVTALVRTLEILQQQSPQLTVYQEDALNQNDITHAMSNTDTVMSALSTDQNNILSKSMPFIIHAMKITVFQKSSR